MDLKNIRNLIQKLLENKNYYNFKKLDSYFYANGSFSFSDIAILKFHLVFGKFVNTEYDYYLWTIMHEYLVEIGLLHDELPEHHFTQDELRIPESLIDEIGSLLEGSDVSLLPYCQIEQNQLWLVGGILQLDNDVISNVTWNANVTQ